MHSPPDIDYSEIRTDFENGLRQSLLPFVAIWCLIPEMYGPYSSPESNVVLKQSCFGISGLKQKLATNGNNLWRKPQNYL